MAKLTKLVAQDPWFSLRIALIIWLYTTAILRQLYSGGLESDFSVQVLPKQLDRLSELLDEDYRIYIPTGTAIYQQLQDSSRPEYRRLMAKAREDETLVSRDRARSFDTLTEILAEKAGLIFADFGMLPMIDQYYNKERLHDCEEPPFRFVQEFQIRSQ